MVNGHYAARTTLCASSSLSSSKNRVTSECLVHSNQLHHKLSQKKAEAHVRVVHLVVCASSHQLGWQSRHHRKGKNAHSRRQQAPTSLLLSHCRGAVPCGVAPFLECETLQDRMDSCIHIYLDLRHQFHHQLSRIRSHCPPPPPPIFVTLIIV